jgi:hypothetical protein
MKGMNIISKLLILDGPNGGLIEAMLLKANIKTSFVNGSKKGDIYCPGLFDCSDGIEKMDGHEIVHKIVKKEANIGICEQDQVYQSGLSSQVVVVNCYTLQKKANQDDKSTGLVAICLVTHPYFLNYERVGNKIKSLKASLDGLWVIPGAIVI